jgi:hypothetical protein
VDPEDDLTKRIDMLARTAMVLLVVLTVFTPLAAQAACVTSVCAVRAGCGMSAMLGDRAACCTIGAPMMGNSCATGHERPSFVATSSSSDLVAPATAIGVVASLTGDPSSGRAAGVVIASSRSPGDSLAGTRLRI